MDKKTIQKIIDTLYDNRVDGEIMQGILRGACMEEQMLNQLVGTADAADLKNAIASRDSVTRAEIIRRMRLVEKDANAIIVHLLDEKPLEEVTFNGAHIHTHIDNITTACDLSDDESKTWKL